MELITHVAGDDPEGNMTPPADELAQDLVVPESDDTLATAREYVVAGRQVKGGVLCPCCGQRAKNYDRHLNEGMALSLLALAKLHKNMTPGPNSWIPIGQWRKEVQVRFGVDYGANLSGDYAKLEFWGLVRRMPREWAEVGDKPNGKWQITEDGLEFARGNAKVFEIATLYNNKFLGFKGEEVTIQECLSKPFDYWELMEAAETPE